MKEKQLRRHATCTVCKELIGHTGMSLFWTVEIKRHGIEMGAVRRQDGLAALIGGSNRLAQAMGTDEEMTTTILDKTVTLCEHCAMLDLPVARLVEME